jgi:hypothetical protein
MNMLRLTQAQIDAHNARIGTARVVKGKDTGGEKKPVGRPPKYRNTPTTVDEIKFASKRESERYAELKLLEKAGEITDLKLQPKFQCEVNGQKICNYFADFTYLKKNGERVTEDVKGMPTPVFRLKKKLVLALFGVDVVVIT